MGTCVSVSGSWYYFGEPVYSYDIAQGVEDGYLAACEIVRRDVFLEAKAASEIATGLAPGGPSRQAA